jgi:4-hydroxy-tetrahydrodipicolinate reductase
MGKPIVETIINTDGLDLVGAYSRSHVGEDAGTVAGLQAPCGITITDNLESLLANSNADVAVDVTQPELALNNSLACINAGVRPVIGTSGIGTAAQQTLADALNKVPNLGAMVVPNFAIGGVLMMHFAQTAAKFFKHTEIIELHHNRKLDAPSGTAAQTAAGMANSRNDAFNPALVDETETLQGARGGKAEGDIPIHSVRLPGLVAHQEVLFGDNGQLLTIRHDSFSRDSFMPGVVLATQHVMTITELEVGLEKAMGLA